jgi:hypothetical protein
MPTIVYSNGFENQAPPTANGGGLYSSVVGTWTIDTSVKHSGGAAIKVAVSSGVAASLKQTKSLPSTVVTQSVYLNFGAALPGGTVKINLIGANNSLTVDLPSFSYNPVTGFFLTRHGTSQSQEDNVTVQTNTWYRIDFKVEITGGNQIINVNVNGRTLAQNSYAMSSTNFANVFLGSLRTDHAVAYNVYFDDWIYSVTGSDHPLSGANDYGIEGLLPSADGTHNAGTNIMEDQAGNDIGAVTAYNKINSVPPDVTTYIRQAAIGASNYAEVLFADISAAHSGIHCACAILAYTSETTTSNKAACIVSKDNFASSTEVWGTPSATLDYSDGATNNLFYKTAPIAGAVDDTTVNNLKARMGYSGDATPDPYWIDMMIEVVYQISSNTISLDLVTYSSTINAINVIESEPISLDLVSYSSTFNAITVIESGIISLDLVTHSNTFNALNVIETERYSLDLVSYSSAFNSINVTESEPITLDLVSYFNTFNSISVVESEILNLDLASYSSVVNTISMIESETMGLDLVSYFLAVNTLSVIESELIEIDLVLYSYDFNTISILESEIIGLDLVTYSIGFDEAYLLESTKTIPLDLVSYVGVINDLNVFENEIVYLDLVSYSNTFNVLEVIESDTSSLDLVVFSYSVLSLFVISSEELIKTPIVRCYSILKEERVNIITSEIRINAIVSEERTILIL